MPAVQQRTERTLSMFRNLSDGISEFVSEMWNDIPLVVLGLFVTAVGVFIGALVYMFGTPATILLIIIMVAAAMMHRTYDLFQCVLIGGLLQTLIAPLSKLSAIWLPDNESIGLTLQYIQGENLLILIAVIYLFDYIAEILSYAVISVLKAFRPFAR